MKNQPVQPSKEIQDQIDELKTLDKEELITLLLTIGAAASQSEDESVQALGCVLGITLAADQYGKLDALHNFMHGFADISGVYEAMQQAMQQAPTPQRTGLFVPEKKNGKYLQ